MLQSFFHFSLVLQSFFLFSRLLQSVFLFSLMLQSSFSAWCYSLSSFSASCSAGKFFNTTSSQCEDCAVGYYQQKTGQFYCNWCGLGQTTRDPASTSPSSCYGLFYYHKLSCSCCILINSILHN